MSFEIRLAQLTDIPGLVDMIDRSVRELSKGFYTEAEIEGSVGKVLGLDTQLVRDQTYFLAEVDGRPVASGGWSYRRTLAGADKAPHRDEATLDPATDAAKIRAIFVDPAFARRGLCSRMLACCEAAAFKAGFRKVEMGSTLTGVPVYARCGYMEARRFSIPLDNREHLVVVHMTKSLV